MTKDVRRALLVARRMFAEGGDTTTTTVSPGVSVSSKGSNKSGESTVAKPADKLPLQEPLPATTVNYQNLLPSNMGLLTPASAPGGGLPSIPGFPGGPSGFGSLVPASASLTQPFSGVSSPNLGAPTPSMGASTAPMAGFSNPSLAQATFNYAPSAAVPKLIEPTTNPFVPAGKTDDTGAKGTYDPFAYYGTTAESGGTGGLGGDVGASSGMSAADVAGADYGGSPGAGGDTGAGDTSGEAGGMYARGGHVGATHAMDPRDLPGIHVRTAHAFAAGGAATQGQDQDQDEGEGFDAYHGSPHAFERFDLSKIGTGEGAQAFGHGLYFAENEDIAHGYKHATAARHQKRFLDERPLDTPKNYWGAHDELESKDWRLAKALTNINSQLQQGYDLPGAVKHLSNWHMNDPKLVQAIRDVSSRMRVETPPGHLYHVRIKANPEHFLDWDAPLSEQHPHVQKAISGLGFTAGQDDPTGEKIHRLLVGGASEFGHTKEGAIETAKDLHAAGIPGIKYWDAGSRAQGQGTRNYVIFNPDIIHVKRRYADGGLIQDKYPSHYMPGVGRQVMADGGLMDRPMIQRAMQATRRPVANPESVLRALALSRSLMKGS